MVFTLASTISADALFFRKKKAKPNKAASLNLVLNNHLSINKTFRAPKKEILGTLKMANPEIKKYKFIAEVNIPEEDEFIKISHFYHESKDTALKKLTWVSGGEDYKAFDIRIYADKNYMSSKSAREAFDNIYAGKRKLIKEFYFSKALLDSNSEHYLKLHWADGAKAKFKLDDLYSKNAKINLDGDFNLDAGGKALKEEFGVLSSDYSGTLQNIKNKSKSKDETVKVEMTTKQPIKEEPVYQSQAVKESDDMIKKKTEFERKQREYYQAMASYLQSGGDPSVVNYSQNYGGYGQPVAAGYNPVNPYYGYPGMAGGLNPFLTTGAGGDEDLGPGFNMLNNLNPAMMMNGGFGANPYGGMPFVPGMIPQQQGGQAQQQVQPGASSIDKRIQQLEGGF